MLNSRLRKDKAALVYAAALQNRMNYLLNGVELQCSVKVCFVGKEAKMPERVLLKIHFNEEKGRLTFDRERTPLSILLCGDGNEDLQGELESSTDGLAMNGDTAYIIERNSPRGLSAVKGKTDADRLYGEILLQAKHHTECP